MPSNHIRNVSGLKSYANKRITETQEKVDKAIKELIKGQETINFNSVSERAGVSKAYLYQHIEIRDRIELLRKQQEGLSSPKQVKREMNNASLEMVIVSLRKQNADLKNEIKKLKELISRKYGEEYSNR
jgi:predicted RNA binding protein with dsRBD fold (UPF0201 family)